MIEILIAVLIVIDVMMFVPFFILLFDLWVYVMTGHYVYGFNESQAVMAVVFAFLGVFACLGTTILIDNNRTKKIAQGILDRDKK